MPRAKKFDEQEILEKAMSLFWEKGYSATSIQDLVTHLGVNRASLYDTYGGKDALFKKSFELYRRKNIQGMKTFLNEYTDVRTGFHALFDKAIDESVQDKHRKGCFVVNTTTELIPGDGELLLLLAENKKTIEGIFYDYLKKGEAKNQFSTDKDLRSIASMLFTLYNGLKVISKDEPSRENMARTVLIALSFLD